MEIESLDLLASGSTATDLDALLRSNHGTSFDSRRCELLTEPSLAQLSVEALQARMLAIEERAAWLVAMESSLPGLGEWTQGVGGMLNDTFANAAPDTAEAPSRREGLRAAAARHHVEVLRLYQICSLKAHVAVSAAEEAALGCIKHRALRWHLLLQHIERSASSILETIEGENPTEAAAAMALPGATATFSWIDVELANGTQLFTLHALNELQRLGLRRFQGDCYTEIMSPEGYHTHAWRRHSTIREFVYQCGSKADHPQHWRRMTSRSDGPRSVEAYLNSCRDHEFPDISFDRSYISFRNGVYATREDAFYPYATRGAELGDSLVSMNYLDHDLDPSHVGDGPLPCFRDMSDAEAGGWFEIPTPNVDLIFQAQDYDDATMKTAYAFLGRLFHDVGALDQWQVAPFMMGIAGSGKP